ncbi:hypothetical protein A2U01_0066363, partial [Trifolium medium]|nr:hypothetical protein [Trifolium medium]
LMRGGLNGAGQSAYPALTAMARCRGAFS